MTISESLSVPSTSSDVPAYDRMTSAIVTRDFAALGATLSPDVRLRALVPPGPFELSGTAAVVAQFEHWFGGGRTFEVLGHSTDVIGSRVHPRWTIRRTPDSPDAGPLVAEQHAYVNLGATVEVIDLLCGGWQDARA